MSKRRSGKSEAKRSEGKKQKRLGIGKPAGAQAVVEKTFTQLVALLSPLSVESSIRYVVVTYFSLTLRFNSQPCNNTFSKMRPEVCSFS